jgi:hypothetical protein
MDTSNLGLSLGLAVGLELNLSEMNGLLGQ